MRRNHRSASRRTLSSLFESAALGFPSAKEISRTAKERKVGSLGYAEAILIAYNRKMKNALRWAKLYTRKGEMPDDIDFREMDGGAESDEEYEQSTIEG